jgi:virulence factor Mce-like protein
MNSRSAPSLGGVIVIAGFVLSCFGLLLFLWMAFGGSVPLSPKGYRFEVSYPDAATLGDQSDVRVSGVTVGKVVKRRRDPSGNRQIATIELQQKYAPLRSDARTMLRQKTLLGETYVEMTLGTRGAKPLPEGGRLPDAAVAEAVEFDELLRTFDAPTRRNLQRWQATTRRATAGRSQDISDALGNFPTFAESGETLVQILNGELGALRSVVRDTGTTFAALTRDADALQGTIRGSDRVLGTLAQRREALADSVRIFPTFLDETRLTLTRTARFAERTDPLLRDLDPVLDDLQPTLASLQRLGPDAERLFEDLPPLVRAGQTGLPALGRVLRGLDPTLASVGPLLQNLNPVLEFLELYQGTVANFLNIGPSTLGVKLATPPGSKSTGHALPQHAIFGSQSLPAQERTRDNRGNTYFAPDGLVFSDKAARLLIPPNWDCRHVGEKGPGGMGDPGCFEAGPVTFDGRTSKFPQVRLGRPGGLMARPPGS